MADPSISRDELLLFIEYFNNQGFQALASRVNMHHLQLYEPDS